MRDLSNNNNNNKLNRGAIYFETRANTDMHVDVRPNRIHDFYDFYLF